MPLVFCLKLCLLWLVLKLVEPTECIKASVLGDPSKLEPKNTRSRIGRKLMFHPTATDSSIRRKVEQISGNVYKAPTGLLGVFYMSHFKG